MIEDLPSPNQDDRPAGLPIDILVLHYTGMRTAREAIDRLRDPASRVSSHYVVDEDGTTYQLVAEARRAFHAGVSYWRGATELNARSIGIEIVNPGHEWGYRAFPDRQMAAVRDLSLAILARHPIPARNVVAHSDVAPTRKQDPGEKFDFRGLAASGVGLWPEATPRAANTDPVTVPVALAELRHSLADIGYNVASEGPPDAALSAVLRAFQRHWRADAVTGDVDSGTLAQVLAVARLCQESV